MAVYWLGANGSVYYKGANGVQDLGPVVGGMGSSGNWKLSNGGFESNTLRQSVQATRIADPNPPRPSAPAPSNPNNTNSGGGGSSGPAPVDKSNDIALQNSGLSAVDQQYNSGVSAIDTALSKLTGQYDTEAKANEGNYTAQSNNNQNNLQKNKQTAYVNAAQGRQGLFGTLSSLGALNGDGISLANRAVQTGANADLSGAADNYGTNQSGLDTAIGTFRQEDKMRHDNAQTAADNAKTNAKNEAAKSRMGFYGNLSNDYAAMGDSANASKFSGLAASLYPELATTSIPNSNLAYSGAAFTPGTLADYMAGGQNTVVSTTPSVGGQSIPGLVASPTKKRQLQSV